MRRARKRQSKKLYAAGYLHTPQEAGGRRNAVLAICNVAGAIGLISLISYGFFSDRLETVAESDAAVPESAAVAFAIEPTRADPGAIAGTVAVASLAPSLHAALPAPEITGTPTRKKRTPRVSTPSDAVLLRASLVEDLDGAGLADAPLATPAALRRVTIGEAPAAGAAAPIRLASIGSVSDLLPSAPSSVVDPESLSFGSLFREPGRHLRGPNFDGIPAPARVPLMRRGDAGAVLTLSFAIPPFSVRDVDPESRSDLVEAEAIAEEEIEEREMARDRRLARERYCLAAAVYYEARGEPLTGQQAVAQVVLNRVADARYPSTVCGVVFQDENRKHRCQFSFACDGKPERPRPGFAWSQSLDIARDFLNGTTYEPVASATHYHADYVTPGWSGAMTRVRQIGNHIFYSES